ncbi:unnamed protein product [Moneuplotes crassus]|uniref:B box-type domain-containing protein n=1 Tax=Euplotes crassus TaxID=5936 RepID=A0AAD1U1T5_EUPCR|nr:unnamed protein product [Moneuplotes crassus]
MQRRVLCSICKVYRPNSSLADHGDDSHCCSHYSVNSVCGIPINRIPTDQIQAQRNSFTDNWKEIVMEGEQDFINEIVICIICKDIPHPERAIKVMCCRKIWCLDCVLMGMKSDTKCSHCRRNINIGLFEKVSIFDEATDQLMKYRKRRNVKCKAHKRDAVFFCNDCDTFICPKGAISTHKGHELIEKDQKHKDLCKEIKGKYKRLKERNLYTHNIKKDVNEKYKRGSELQKLQLEPSISMIAKSYCNYYQNSWGWFVGFQSKLDEMKDFEESLFSKNIKNSKEDSLPTLNTLLEAQKKLHKYGESHELYSAKLEKLNKRCKFENERHIFQFKIKYSKDRIKYKVTSNGVECILLVEHQCATICIANIKRAVKRKAATKPKKKVEIKNSESGKKERKKCQKERTKMDQKEREQFKEKESRSKKKICKSRKISKSTHAPNKPSKTSSKKYIVLQEKVCKLFDEEKGITVHKFISIVGSSPIDFNLDPFITKGSTICSIKLIAYEYSSDLGSHLISSLNTTYQGYKECLKTTSDTLKMLNQAQKESMSQPKPSLRLKSCKKYISSRKSKSRCKVKPTSKTKYKPKQKSKAKKKSSSKSKIDHVCESECGEETAASQQG